MSLSRRWHALLTREASSRLPALLRIGLAVIALARFGDEMLPTHDHRPGALAARLVFYLSTLAMLAGYRGRLACVVSGAAQLVMTTLHHHTYLLAMETLLLALTPCDRSYSADRWLALKAGDAPPERGPSYGLTLMALQLSAVYLWGIVHKLEPLYLRGVRLEHILRYYQLGSDEVAVPAWLWAALALAVVAIEAVLLVGLWIRRWHRWVMPLGIAFHGALYYALRVDTFTAQVWLLYLTYVDPDAIHRGIDALGQRLDRST